MRYYSTVAGAMKLEAAVGASDTNISLDTTTGLPASFPFTLILDVGETNEEVVDVTALSSNTATVTRGKDGTSATTHSLGANVRHGLTARDLRESRQHEDATAVHGATGAVVGTTNAQTLTNKTINGNSNTLTNIGKSSLPSTVVYTSDTQTLTNKTLNSPTLSNPTVSGTLTGGKVAASNLTGSTSDEVAPYNYAVATSSTSPANQTWAAPGVLGGTGGQAGSHGSWNYSNGEFTIPVAGRYHVDYQVGFATNANGSRAVRVSRGGDGLVLISTAVNALPNLPTRVGVSKAMVFAAGDVLKFECWQSSGGSLGVQDADAETFVSISYLGAA